MRPSMTIAVDLATRVFELAVANERFRIIERHRLNRGQFLNFFAKREPCEVVMEACGTAHHWARELQKTGLLHAAAAGAVRRRLSPAQQDRSGRLRGNPRGGPQCRDSERAYQKHRAAGRAGAASNTHAVDELPHRANQYPAGPLARARHPAAGQRKCCDQARPLGGG